MSIFKPHMRHQENDKRYEHYKTAGISPSAKKDPFYRKQTSSRKSNPSKA